MPKNLDPFKLSSAGRPRYWAHRQRRASTELLVSTVCTMTSFGQAAHSISQALTKHLAFHSSRFSFRRPQCLSLREGAANTYGGGPEIPGLQEKVRTDLTLVRNR
jgi:hypothetical protein